MSFENIKIQKKKKKNLFKNQTNLDINKIFVNLNTVKIQGR